MRFLVTGGSGFIGSHLVDLLLNEGHHVAVVDNFSTSTISNLETHLANTCLDVIEADISRTGSWQQAVKDSDRVVHLAGLASIIPSIDKPRSYFDVNVTGTLNLLEALTPSTMFLYAASSSCYGLNSKCPTSENEPIDTQYPYALTKYLGEELVLHWRKVYKTMATSLRLFNVYGTRSKSNNSYGAMFGTFLAQLNAKKPLTIVGNGEQKRDFVYVTDVAKAFYGCCISPSILPSIMNVGRGVPVSVNRIAQLLGGEVVFIPKRPGEPDVTHADIRLIRETIGWQPEISIEEGISILKENILMWKDAPVWTPTEISRATHSWFKQLSA
jgi:UDP-glucose 4-epimerase